MTMSADKIKLMQEKLAALRQFLKDIKPDDQKDLKIEDLKYGLVDKFLFSKATPDANGYHSNIKLIHTTFDAFKDLVSYVSRNMQTIKNNVVIGFKPINDGYHFKVVKVFNVDKPNDLDKYLILM